VEAILEDLEAALGHGFARRELLVRALTHRSLAHEQAAAQGNGENQAAGDNERLEFLGDAVLGLVVAEAMFVAHPEWQEGELTRVRSQLVSRKHMAEVALTIGLGNYLRLSRGEERGGLRNKGTVLSNSMEAVLGALFLGVVKNALPVIHVSPFWQLAIAGVAILGAVVINAARENRRPGRLILKEALTT